MKLITLYIDFFIICNIMEIYSSDTIIIIEEDIMNEYYFQKDSLVL